MLLPSSVKIIQLVDRQVVNWNGGVISPLLSLTVESKWTQII